MIALAVRGLLVARAQSLPDSFDVRWLYGLQPALALVAIALCRRSYHELRCVPQSASAIAISAVTGLAVFVLWVAPMPTWMHMEDPVATFVPTRPDGTLRWDLISVRVLGAVLVVPPVEELFWRSFLMRWIDRREFLALAPGAVSWFALFSSSLVFGLAHELWFAGLIAGSAYALLYCRLGNLWYPIFAHATTNFALALWVLARGAWSYW